MTALGSLQCAYHVRAPMKLISHCASLLVDERMTRGAVLQCAYHVRPADVRLGCDACLQVTMLILVDLNTVNVVTIGTALTFPRGRACRVGPSMVKAVNA